jgi:histidine triad (HIT) family protein
MDCLFCKIIAGEIPAKIIYQDEKVVAFDDINPQAPHHKMVPRKHIATLNEVTEEDSALLGYMVQSATKLAKELKLAEKGYRVVFNCNSAGGQTVYHIHLHLLGGRSMTWPPG